MPRLKTLLSCVGLSSLGSRLRRASRHTDQTPIEPRADQFKINPANRWQAWKTPVESAPSCAVEQLSSVLMELRRTLAQVAGEAPLRTEAEAAPASAAMAFDQDLFDGEPVFAGQETLSVTGLDDDLFEEASAPVQRAPAPSHVPAACQPSA